MYPAHIVHLNKTFWVRVMTHDTSQKCEEDVAANICGHGNNFKLGLCTPDSLWLPWFCLWQSEPSSCKITPVTSCSVISCFLSLQVDLWLPILKWKSRIIDKIRRQRHIYPVIQRKLCFFKIVIPLSQEKFSHLCQTVHVYVRCSFNSELSNMET